MAEEKKKTVSKKNNLGTKTSSKKLASAKPAKKTTTSSKKVATKPAAKTSTSKKASVKKTTSKKSAPKKTVKTTPKKVENQTKNIKASKDKIVKKLEINKKKLIVSIIITVLVVALCIVCFCGSSSVSEKYTNNKTTNDTSDSSDTLAQATKEAGEISDDIRKEPESISVDDYLELYESDELSLVLLSKESCSYCKIAVPIIENIIYESDVKINHIDVGNINQDDIAKLISSDSYFSEGYGTPLLMIVGQNGIKDKIEGLTTKDGYIKFFKENGFME